MLENSCTGAVKAQCGADEWLLLMVLFYSHFSTHMCMTVQFSVKCPSV